MAPPFTFGIAGKEAMARRTGIPFQGLINDYPHQPEA
jgi:hypothetical protein